MLLLFDHELLPYQPKKRQVRCGRDEIKKTAVSVFTDTAFRFFEGHFFFTFWQKGFVFLKPGNDEPLLHRPATMYDGDHINAVFENTRG